MISKKKYAQAQTNFGVLLSVCSLKLAFFLKNICNNINNLALYIYTSIIKLKSLFVCLNAVISGTPGSNLTNLFVLDIPLTEKATGYIPSRYDQ